MSFLDADGKCILLNMIHTIQDNRAYLSEVDGLIGDGDHGVNMNKGFTIFEHRIAAQEIGFCDGLNQLGMILVNEIGGSMGPIYGTIFMEMADAAADTKEIDENALLNMLETALTALYEIIEARPGDKTLVDTLVPAIDALKAGINSGKSFEECLESMRIAAQDGCRSTKNLIAKFGRSARLGERSIGVQDAGATSCCLLLTAMCDGIEALLKEGR